MLPANVSRVPSHTASEINARIAKQTEDSVFHYARLGNEAIEERLRELDYEWDIERLLETNASSAILLGLTLGLTVDRRFLVIPGVVAGFLLMHALQGWCPPLPVFRSYGFRTAAEIDYERYALKAIRGDFEGIAVQHRRADSNVSERALSAVQS
jgi:hypothetical protein